MEWTTEAEGAIKKVPFFVRKKVRARVEKEALDINKPHLVPMYNPVSHIVYSATGADVRDVIINGETIVRNRQILTMDVADILDKARIFANELRL